MTIRLTSAMLIIKKKCCFSNFEKMRLKCNLKGLSSWNTTTIEVILKIDYINLDVVGKP